MAKIKTIAVVANSAWNIVNFRLGLIEKLVQQQYVIYAIAPQDYDDQKIIQTGAKFVSLKNLQRKGVNPIQDLMLLLELKSIYRKYDIDLILNFTIKPAIYGSLASGSRKVMNTITGLGYSFMGTGLVNKMVKSLYKIALKKTNFVIFQNEDDQKEFLRLKLLSPTKTRIIEGSGINIQKFSYYPIPEKKGLLKVLFVGRMLIDKGIKELFEAIKLLQNEAFEFHLVGAIDHDNPAALTQSEFDRFKNLPNVVYHGQVSDPQAFYKECHIVILPSYREGLPRVILEAMATGRPTIVTDVPGCRQTIVDGENGFLIQVKNSQDIVTASRKMNELSHEQLTQMGLKGRALVDHRFDEKIIVERYLSIIHDIEKIRNHE